MTWVSTRATKLKKPWLNFWAMLQTKRKRPDVCKHIFEIYGTLVKVIFCVECEIKNRGTMCAVS
jgi:hypothetical protein